MTNIKSFKIINKPPLEIFAEDLELAVKSGVKQEYSMPYFKQGGNKGVMLIHGICSSPWEMLPVAEALIKDNFTVYVPRVAGHGISMDSLIKTTWQDWYNSLLLPFSALSAHCSNITIIGQSNGGLLACAVAMNNTISALGLLAPAFKTRFKGFSLVKYLRFAVKYLPRRLKGDYKLYNYAGFPLNALNEMRLMQGYVLKHIENISVPTMLGISQNDRLVSESEAIAALSSMACGDKTLHLYNNKEMNIHHILTVPRMEHIRCDIIKWVKRVTNG